MSYNVIIICCVEMQCMLRYPQRPTQLLMGGIQELKRKLIAEAEDSPDEDEVPP